MSATGSNTYVANAAVTTLSTVLHDRSIVIAALVPNDMPLTGVHSNEAAAALGIHLPADGLTGRR
jgi:hypothetical protein